MEISLAEHTARFLLGIKKWWEHKRERERKVVVVKLKSPPSLMRDRKVNRGNRLGGYLCNRVFLPILTHQKMRGKQADVVSRNFGALISILFFLLKSLPE